MSTREARVGILLMGCGWASAIHSRMLRRLGGVELFYASRDAARAEEYRRRYGGTCAFGSYADGLAEPRVDIALVATPTVTHRDLAVQSLEAGKHVIVEKPAFMRARDADVVREIATAVDRQVFVAENYAYKPIANHLRRSIGSGDLGEIRFVTLNATKRRGADAWRGEPAASGGGALFEGGVHWVSFAANLGLEVEAVRGYRAAPADGPERSTLVVFEYSGGAVGTLAHSWELAAPFGGLRLSKVQGTLGAVTFESNGLAALTTGRHRSVRLMAFSDPFGYRAMLEDFLHAVRTGGAPRFTLEMARRDLSLLEQAERSTEQHAAHAFNYSSAAGG
jgi:UDP-N-acetylglucosamine 3-dehydrogenase